MPAVRLLATGGCVGQQNVKVMIGKNHELYLTNVSDTDIAIGPAEIFGFNLGSFTERITAEARSATDGILWRMKTDGEILIAESPDGKKPLPLSHFICQQAGDHGVMDIDVQGYNLTQQTQAGA